MHQLPDEALLLYNFERPRAELIRHNENATFKIIDDIDEKTYVLRIHKPADGFSPDILHQGKDKKLLVASEMNILSNLAAIQGISIQQPIPNRNGSFTTTLSDGSYATVLSWVDGNIVSEKESSENTFREIGRTIAVMHSFFAENEFYRFSYDQQLLPYIAENMCLSAKANAITNQQLQTALSAIEEMCRRFNKLDQTGLRKHIVHSDLSKSNIIHNNGIITPIDFSLCGYSHFYLDIASLFGHFEDENNRCSLLEGYKSIHKHEIDAYFIEPYCVLESLMFFACQYERASGWDWWNEVWEKCLEKELEPLINNIQFIRL